MPDDIGEIKVALARVEAKLDGVSQHLDDAISSVRAQIASGDNTNAQATLFVERDVKRAHERLDEAEKDRDKIVVRVEVLEQAEAPRLKTMAIDLEELKTWRSNLTGRMYVIGGLLVFITPLLTAVLLKLWKVS